MNLLTPQIKGDTLENGDHRLSPEIFAVRWSQAFFCKRHAQSYFKQKEPGAVHVIDNVSLFVVWSLDKLSNKIYDMRDLYNQCVEEDIPFSETVSKGFCQLVAIHVQYMKIMRFMTIL